MHRAEGDARVVSLEHHPRTGGVQPEAEAVTATFRGNIASGPPGRRQRRTIKDRAIPQRSPQSMNVGDRGVCTPSPLPRTGG